MVFPRNGSNTKFVCSKLSNLATKFRVTYCTAYTNSFLKLNKPVWRGAGPRGFSRCNNLKGSALRSEFRAVRGLFNRSGLSYVEQNKILRRGIRTSCALRQEKPPPDKNDKDKDKKNEDMEKMSALMTKAFLWMITAYMLLAFLSLFIPNSGNPELVKFVSWNEFLHHMLSKGEVEEIIVRPDLDMVTIVLHEGAIIKGKRVEQNTYHMNIVDTAKFEAKLREAEASLGISLGHGVQIVYERGSDTAGKLLMSIILASILLSLLSRARTVKNPLSIDKISQLGRAKFTLIDPHTGQGKGVKFTDVAGLTEVKMEVMEIVDYLKKPELYKQLGAKVPKGALLLGPPGCGKTLLAKAVATEAEIPFLSMNGSEFMEMIGGLGAARVRDLFKEGRKRAPCIIYIDEIDAMGRKRSGSNLGGGFEGGTGEGEQTLNQLLVEMDGMASKEGVLVLASTNRADVLDKALLRPGRFDRHILIDLPTVKERVDIFEHHLKGIALSNPPHTYSKRLAYLTPGFSGADIANVVNEAALHAARYLKKKVEKEDLEYAVERVVGGTEKRNHAMSEEEKETVAVHESGHALVGWLLPFADILLKVTIVPRTNLALGFAQYTPSDQKLYTKEEMFAKMCMALGGRVAESLVFNKITTGAQNDLKKVTDMAYSMVRVYGMDEKVGLISFTEGTEGRKPYSKKLNALIDHQARQLTADAYKETERILLENRPLLDKLSSELLKKETLSYNDVEALIGPPKHGNKKMIEPVEFEASLNSLTKKESDENSVPERVSPKSDSQ
ncbi:paraplegin [Cimex lectularius]|uniref:AAA+ ATPase domain-containing protein n=1 Tax=Cimex lectularius TaxID=79782 RepID=A0A8I6TD54_CIMLE|nr:paraplegin [Cimex lectularius]